MISHTLNMWIVVKGWNDMSAVILILGVFACAGAGLLYGFAVKTRWSTFFPKEDQPWYQELPTDLDERDIYE